MCGVHRAWIHVFWTLILHIRHLKRHHRTRSLDIHAHQLLQWGCVNNVKSNFPTKCARHPVFRRTNSISHEAFERVGRSHLHHSLPKHRDGSGFLHKKASIQLNRIYVTVQLLHFGCQLLVSCFTIQITLQLNKMPFFPKCSHFWTYVGFFLLFFYYLTCHLLKRRVGLHVEAFPVGI